MGRTLFEIERRHRSLVDLSPDAILVHADGKYVYANPAAARLFGARLAGDLIGKEVLELVAPEYHDLARERIRLAYDGAITPLRETKFVRFDGQVIDVEATGARVEFGGKPAMNGIQATKIIHSEQPDVHVIGLSMFEEGEQAPAMKNAVAVAYVTKSGPSEAVIAAVRAYAGDARKPVPDQR